MRPEFDIAGQVVADPMATVRLYAHAHRRTLSEYDFGPRGDDYRITPYELKATRIISSRLSNQQLREVLTRANANEALLRAVPPNSLLAQVDPSITDGLYDAMDALFQALRGFGVADGKTSKILHIKRPGLYPILDSRLARLYRDQARSAAARYPARCHRRIYWAAIRDDLLANADALTLLREEIAADDRLTAQRVNHLSDVRLIDILAWQA